MRFLQPVCTLPYPHFNELKVSGEEKSLSEFDPDIQSRLELEFYTIGLTPPI